MKKHLAVLIILAMSIGAACKSGKYSDINSALDDLIAIQDSYITAIQGAQNAGDVAKAINSYADSFIKLKPRIESFEQKYPELKQSKEPPAELQDAFKRLEKSAEKLATASMSMLKYLEAPEVQQAIERLKDLSKTDDAQEMPQGQGPQQGQPQPDQSKSFYQD